MKIDLDIRRATDGEAKVYFKVENYTSIFNCFDYCNIDDVEKLEQDLTNMIQKLYEYRKNKGQS